MSFSDWDILDVGAGSPSLILNDSLSNPLVSGSTYCRRLPAFSGGQSIAQKGNTLKTTSYSGNFYNIPNNQAVRIQSYIRVESVYANSNENFFGFGLKIPDNVNISYSDGTILNSYALGLNSTNPTGVQICLILKQNRIFFDVASLNTWYGLRLEVFPIGTSGDRIKCYKEDPVESGNWGEPFYDEFIASNSSYYIPWSSAPNNSKIGFSTFTGWYQNIVGLIDKFEVKVATAPTPTP